MRKIVIIGLVLFSMIGRAQDYVVSEIFTPEDYSGMSFEINANNRFIYSWGRNYNDSESESFIKPKGSNYFDFRYQYNQKLFLGCYMVFGVGYSWDGYKFKNDSSTLYVDSVFHDKRKMRFQNLTTNLGLRFQSHSKPDESWFVETSFFNDFLMHSAYLTWDEIDDMDHKAKLTKLDFVNKYRYGLEFRFGYGNMAVISRYKMSDIIKVNNEYSNLPKLTFGIQVDIPSSGDL